MTRKPTMDWLSRRDALTAIAVTASGAMAPRAVWAKTGAG